MAEGKIKTLKANDIDQMSSNEIREHISAIKYAQMSLKGKKVQGNLDTPQQLRNNRRTMARMITVLVRRGERVVP